MKTIEDLKAILPEIIKQFRANDHEIGESYLEESEFGCLRMEEMEENEFLYEEDGWEIEIYYGCTGVFDDEGPTYWHPGSDLLIRGWGELYDISVCYREDEDDVTEFSEEECKFLWDAVKEELKDIA